MINYGSAYFFMTKESKVACLLADNVICERHFSSLSIMSNSRLLER